MIMLCNHDLILLPSLYIFEYLNEAHKIVAWGRVGQRKWGRVGQFGAQWDICWNSLGQGGTCPTVPHSSMLKQGLVKDL